MHTSTNLSTRNAASAPTSNTGLPSVLARLRALAPHRGLDRGSALGIAERQANLLLSLQNITAAPVPLSALSRMPRIDLGVAELPTSGLSYWNGVAWQLQANRGEPEVRQRFTLAHEFKHVIDHPSRDLLYGSHIEREQTADQFAACLLMPKRFVVRAWCSGQQDIDQLAELFVVSTEAMTRRLLHLGLLTQRRPRPLYCSRRRSTALRGNRHFAIAGTRSTHALSNGGHP